MANLKKNASGYGYKYTDLAAINEFLNSQGIGYSQYVETSEINGEDYIFTVPVMDGKALEPRRGCKIPTATLSGKSNPAQEYGSALTYARRYSLLLAFGLATEDDDAESLTVKKETAKKAVNGLNNTQIEALKKELSRTGVSESAILNRYKKGSLEELTNEDYAKAIKILNNTATKED